jgi:4-amino-4-deoxy-L-arabinose transferase-like glycosyltransferase
MTNPEAETSLVIRNSSFIRDSGFGIRHFALILILLLAAGLRLYHIGSDSLWFDEAASVRIVRQGFSTMLQSIRDDERIPPLHYLILHAWVRIFGHSEASVRLPSALAGIGAVWVLYLLARRLFGVGPALVAALLLAVAPFQIQYSQEARSYSLMLLLSLTSCWLFVRMLEEAESRSTEAAYVLASAAAIYAHLYALFTLIAQAVTYAVLWTRADKPRWPMRRWFIAQLAIAALFLPWLPITLRWARSVGSGFWLPPATARDLWTPYLAYVGGSMPLLIAVILLAILGIIVQRRNVRGVALMLALATLPVLVPVIVSILSKPTFTPRYGIVAPAALFALAACGVIALRHRIAQIGAAVILAALSLYAIRDIPRKPDWRGAVAHVETVARPKDYIAMTPRRSTYIYDYYAERHDVTRKGFDSGAIPLSVPLDPPGTRVWLIVEQAYDPQDVLARGGWRVRSSRAFEGISILELDDGPLASSPGTPGED